MDVDRADPLTIIPITPDCAQVEASAAVECDIVPARVYILVIPAPAPLLCHHSEHARINQLSEHVLQVGVRVHLDVLQDQRHDVVVRMVRCERDEVRVLLDHDLLLRRPREGS